MEYELIRSSRKTIAVQIRQGTVTVRAPRRTPLWQIEAFLQERQAWIGKHLAASQQKQQEAAQIPPLTKEDLRLLTEKAREVIPRRVAYYAPLVGVTYRTVTIRHQHTRWGSCSKEGSLNFNCLLMLAPADVVDCIVVHELCHRKQMNHSEKFYAEVLRVFPGYWESHRWLKENGEVLLAMLKNYN